MLRIISASLFFAAPSAATTWTVAEDWNAVPSGTPTTVTDLAACEAKAAGHAQFAFNENSKHCYVSDATTFGGKFSDHATSGCDAAVVARCSATPGGGGGGGVPRWTAPKPDPTKTPGLGGYARAPPAFQALVHRGTEALGTYNHNVMFEYAVGLGGFFMQWKNCQTDEDCNGQRMLYTTSPDARAWAPAAELFPNMTTPGLMLALEPGPPVRVGGRVYAAASPGVRPDAGNKHDVDAQGSQFCLWPDPLNPRNCGPASDVAVQYEDSLLLRRVLPGGAGLGPIFWASQAAPALFAAASAALNISALPAQDAQTRADIAALHDGEPAMYEPGCGPGSAGAARDGTLKCEACRGGCHIYASIDKTLGIANERTHFSAPDGSTETILYRAQNHLLWASTRNASSSSSSSSSVSAGWAEIQVTDIPNDNSNLNSGALPDGRVYLLHNPVTPAPTPKRDPAQGGSHPSQRDPITVATSADGVNFDSALVAMTCTDLDAQTGCLPRFEGKSKNAGPSYPQGVTVTAPAPVELRGFYVGASVNKEDIWVTKLNFSSF